MVVSVVATGCGSGEGTVSAEVDDLAEAQSVDAAVGGRYGFVASEKLWFAGGVVGSPEAWKTPLNTVTRVTSDGSVVDVWKLPLRDDRMLQASSVLSDGTGVVVLGTTCRLPVGDSPSCGTARSEPEAVLYRLHKSGEVDEVRLPALQTNLSTNATFRTVGVIGGKAYVVRGSDYGTDVAIGATNTNHVFGVHLAAGEATPLKTPRDADSGELETDLGLCTTSRSIYALTLELNEVGQAIGTVHLHRAEPKGGIEAWEQIASIPWDAALPGLPRLACTSGGDVFLMSLGTAIDRIVSREQTIPPQRSDLGGSPVGLQQVGDQLLVVARSESFVAPGSAKGPGLDATIVWEYDPSGGFRKLAEEPATAMNWPTVLRVDDALLDVSLARQSGDPNRVPLREFG
jgi:hypothetical protein